MTSRFKNGPLPFLFVAVVVTLHSVSSLASTPCLCGLAINYSTDLHQSLSQIPPMLASQYSGTPPLQSDKIPLDLNSIVALSNQTNNLNIAGGSNPLIPSPPPTYRHGPRSDTEKVFDIDRQLDESLSEFDGKLLREKRLLDDLENATEGDESSIGGETTGQFPSEGKLADPASRTGDQTKTKSSEQKNAGQAEHHRSGPGHIPPDIPDGKDDDIVARQIREAAEREKDPALRNKLWDEYRKYKQNSGI